MPVPGATIIRFNYPFMYKLRSSYNNIYWVRLADIILMKAEAEAYKGNLAESAKLVNQIRKRAKLKELTSDKTGSKESMIEAVLHERRLELAFEETLVRPLRTTRWSNISTE